MAWMADLMDALGQDRPKRHGLVTGKIGRISPQPLREGGKGEPIQNNG
jgi:hypothetical protein